MSCLADDFGPIALPSRDMLADWAAGALCRPECASNVSSQGRLSWGSREEAPMRCGEA